MSYNTLFKTFNSDRLNNALQQSSNLSDAVIQYQKQQKAAPFQAALEQLGNQFRATNNPGEQSRLNTLANQARSDYINAGGSPMDLSKNLWGSNPNQGFQTGQGQFKPSYYGDNLSYGQKQMLAPTTGYFEGKPTLERLFEEAATTGMFGGQKTWSRQLGEQELDLKRQEQADDQWYNQQQIELKKQELAQDAAGGGSSSGGSSGDENSASTDAYSFLKKLKSQGGTYEKAMDLYYSNPDFANAGISEAKFKNMVKLIFPEESNNDWMKELMGEPSTTPSNNKSFVMPSGVQAILDKIKW